MGDGWFGGKAGFLEEHFSNTQNTTSVRQAPDWTEFLFPEQILSPYSILGFDNAASKDRAKAGKYGILSIPTTIMVRHILFWSHYYAWE